MVIEDMEGNKMEEKKMITITLENGAKEDVELLLSFKFNDNNKEYVIYTKNETDANGNVTIYVSNVSDDNEWARIKDLLRELSKNE